MIFWYIEKCTDEMSFERKNLYYYINYYINIIEI